jgi:hypothetical protein
MKKSALLLIILACCLMVLIAGCINQQQAIPIHTNTIPATNTPVTSVPVSLTPAVTTITTSAGGTGSGSLSGELSQPLSPYAVDISVAKDRVYSTITVTFLGGPGQIFVKDVLVRVTRSDGLKEENHIPFSDQIPIGASVDLPGTKGSDRVEVYATINGVTYKVRDENAVYARY